MSGWDNYCKMCANQNEDIKYLGVFSASPVSQWGSYSNGSSVDPSCVAGIAKAMSEDKSFLYSSGIILQEGDIKKYLYVKALPFDTGSCTVGRLKNSLTKEHVLIYKNEKNVLVSVVGETMSSYDGAEFLNRIAISL